MSGEILSGLISGIFGPMIGKILGRFRLWKVFFVTLTAIYAAIFFFCLVSIGYKMTLLRFGEFFTLPAILSFLAAAGFATMAAFFGKTAIENSKNSNGEN